MESFIQSLFLCLIISNISLTIHLGNQINQTFRTGPIVTQTHGEVWPKPQKQTTHHYSFQMDPSDFAFHVIGYSCDILELGLNRYKRIISTLYKGQQHNFNIGQANAAKRLRILTIHLKAPCEVWPRENMDERYQLDIGWNATIAQGKLSSKSIWGILRGLETFSQLPFWNGNNIQMNGTSIDDWPRFPHRSLLLDSSRHFLPLETLYDNLDLMSMVKLNILHWHITDNEAFPFRSDSFPNLHQSGSYHPTHEYSKDEIINLLEYARIRGIRIIPEFDTPGHTQSWLGQPGLLTQCYTNGTPNGILGHVDPSNEQNYYFFKIFFKEILDTFPDAWIHLGGDEVSSDCWDSNPNVKSFMDMKGFGNDFSLLEDYHMHRISEIVKELKPESNQIGWQEVYFNNKRPPHNMIIHIWILEELDQLLANVTSNGHRTLLGSCWYLDHISYGVDWHKYYHCDPHNFNGTQQQKDLVIGGGPNFWSEYIDQNNLIPLLWPRAAVPSERLWSAQHVNDTSEAAPRLEEFRCKLLRRGFKASPPNGAGYCL